MSQCFPCLFVSIIFFMFLISPAFGNIFLREIAPSVVQKLTFIKVYNAEKEFRL